MNIISIINAINAQECLKNASFAENWNRYKGEIMDYLGEYPSKTKIIRLGSELSKIFTSSQQGGRGQSDVSVSGNAWARLVNWYLNLCLVGTNCWAVNSVDLLPEKVKRALSLSIGGRKVQNSKEIIVLAYNGQLAPTVTLPNDLSGLDLKMTYSHLIRDFFESVELSELKIILVSAKTTCSDLLAIPLFWNFCYKGNMMNEIFNIKVGTDIEKPENFYGGRIHYSVVTVPSGKEERIVSGAIPGKAQINKLSLLDGGFYWGRHSTENVRSFENFFNDNLLEWLSDIGKVASNDFEYMTSPRSFLYQLFTV